MVNKPFQRGFYMQRGFHMKSEAAIWSQAQGGVLAAQENAGSGH